MRRVTSVLLAATIVLIAGVATPARTAGAVLWTLTAAPLTVASGSTTTFSLTALNPDVTSTIRCIVVTVPGIFAVESASGGSGWSASASGNAVTVSSATGIGGPLKPISTTFSIRARALGPGQIAWASVAWSQQGCSGTRSVLGAPPIVLVLGPSVTPTPVPTPAPTPPPTPTPTIPLPTLPVPTLPLPTLPVPTATPRPTPTPEATPSPTDGGGGPTGPGDPSGPPRASGTPAPGGSGGPDASPSDEPDPDGSGSVPGAPNSGGGPGGSGGNGFGFQPGRVDVGGPGLGVLGGIDVWIVPAASLAGPGLLILLWIALQAIGAVAWVPIVRRFRGAGEEPA